MKVPIIGEIDERFLTHRLKSTSHAGVLSSITATLLFAYRYYFNHRWNWDLLAVSLTFLLIKYAVLAWYRFHD